MFFTSILSCFYDILELYACTLGSCTVSWFMTCELDYAALTERVSKTNIGIEVF